MAKDGRVEERESWSALVNGIVEDITRLFAHEIELAKLELKHDIAATKSFVIWLALGATVALIGLVFIFLMFVFVIYENSGLSLWASFGIMAGVSFLIGGSFLFVARRKTRGVDFMPSRARHAVKEDIGWISSTIRTSGRTSNSGSKHVPH